MTDLKSELSETLATIPALTALFVVSVVLYSVYYFYDRFTAEPLPFLEADKWKLLPLIDRVELNHNTRRFRFALPDKRQRAGLPIGKHISLKAVANGEQVIKPYTPVSDEEVHRGFIDFVIKVYPEGRMSQHLDKLAIGDKMEFKGPKGQFKYFCNMKRSIGMLAGGTGITPMYQTARAILKDLQDTTRVSLIFGNITQDDILIKDLLDELEQQHPDRFKVFYVLNEAPAGWTGGTGFVTPDMIQKHLPGPADDTLVLRCGPPAMNKAMASHLNSMGYTKDMQFEF